MLFARRGSTAELQQGLVVDTRPTLMRAGGETRNAGDWEDQEDGEE